MMLKAERGWEILEHCLTDEFAHLWRFARRREF
jgi:hypothetical protein